MKFYLRDRNPKITEAWQMFFKDNPDFDVSTGNIFEGPKTDAIISPANSFGFMCGGIDAVYTALFGVQLQNRLQALIKEQFFGEIPVGQAAIIETNHTRHKWLICAPTMRVPDVVKGTVNAFLAFRASLLVVKHFNEYSDTPIESILCPGLGTAVGELTSWSCARQMYEAYKAIWLGQPKDPTDIADIFCQNRELAQ
jgi:O-acetyl-ADP-ribose deacetylase (regulator of RNase III)